MPNEDDERARGEGGEFVQERKPADVLEVMEPLKPYMTGEIAEELGWPRRTAYEILNGPADDGEIRKKPEARRVILCMKIRLKPLWLEGE